MKQHTSCSTNPKGRGAGADLPLCHSTDLEPVAEPIRRRRESGGLAVAQQPAMPPPDTRKYVCSGFPPLSASLPSSIALPQGSNRAPHTYHENRPVREGGSFPASSRGASRSLFGRVADLDRAYEDGPRRRCLEEEVQMRLQEVPRHEQPFFRQDHFRDHLRDFHKEDLLRRGVKDDEEWWNDRAQRPFRRGWWRCNRCLVERVQIDKFGFRSVPPAPTPASKLGKRPERGSSKG